MMCPKCEARGYVVTTEPKDDCTLRYYRCHECGNRWKTIERIVKAGKTDEQKG